ncbi:hypothetical protein [Sporolactobacillus terrae]|uniref:hypothetical protein n=1 Tax=Sporolactobacillus terrae TaxID=269673 RepID=UPI00159BD150|nr:hypothetical protein [Sporolactobacillus terrae]
MPAGRLQISEPAANGLSRGQGIRPSARPIEAYCHFSTFFARIAYGNFTMNQL